MVLGVVAHERGILGDHRVGLGHIVGEDHQQDGVVRKSDAAVVDVLMILRHQKAVFVGDVEALLPQLEIAVGLRLLHGLHDGGEAVGIVIQQLQAIDHLPGGEEVVLIIFLLHGLRIFTHVGGDDLPVAVVALAVAEDGPQGPGQLIVRVDDGGVPQVAELISAVCSVPIQLPAGHLFRKGHIQRHLVHAAADHVLVGMEIMLLPGDGVVITQRDEVGIVRVQVVFLQEGPDDLIPGLILVQGIQLRVYRGLGFRRILGLGDFRPGRFRRFGRFRPCRFLRGEGRAGQRQQQAEHRQRAQQLFDPFHRLLRQKCCPPILSLRRGFASIKSSAFPLRGTQGL